MPAGSVRSPSDDGFEALYSHLYPRLVRHCRRIANGSAEDLAQETMVRALRHFPTLDTSTPVWPWLKTIATNLAIDEARRRVREASVVPPVRRAIDAAQRAERLEVLREAMGSLTQHQRTAMRLRYLEGHDPRDAAGSLGLSVAAFNQLVFRARIRLRAELRRLGEGALGAAILPMRWIRSRWGPRAHSFSSGALHRVAPGLASQREAVVQPIMGVFALLIGYLFAAPGLSPPERPLPGAPAPLEVPREDPTDGQLPQHALVSSSEDAGKPAATRPAAGDAGGRPGASSVDEISEAGSGHGGDAKGQGPSGKEPSPEPELPVAPAPPAPDPEPGVHPTGTVAEQIEDPPVEVGGGGCLMELCLPTDGVKLIVDPCLHAVCSGQTPVEEGAEPIGLPEP